MAGQPRKPGRERSGSQPVGNVGNQPQSRAVGDLSAEQPVVGPPMIYDTPRCPPSTRFAELRSVGTTQMMAKVVPMNNQMRGQIGLMTGVSDGTGCAAFQELARNGPQGHHRSPQLRQGRNRSAADHRRYGLPCGCVPVGDLSSQHRCVASPPRRWNWCPIWTCC